MKVQLRYATLPIPLRLFAAHYWYVVWDTDGCHRWEVWQTKNAGGWSLGHVHRDLKPPDSGVGGGPARIAAEWTGAEAVAISAVLKNVSAYPHSNRYFAWPGPNSNTFANWVLRRAGIRHHLGWMALGKRFSGARNEGRSVMMAPPRRPAIGTRPSSPISDNTPWPVKPSVMSCKRVGLRELAL